MEHTSRPEYFSLRGNKTLRNKVNFKMFSEIEKFAKSWKKSFLKTFPWKKILFQRNFFLSSYILIKSFFQNIEWCCQMHLCIFLYVVIFCRLGAIIKLSFWNLELGLSFQFRLSNIKFFQHWLWHWSKSFKVKF